MKGKIIFGLCISVLVFGFVLGMFVDRTLIYNKDIHMDIDCSNVEETDVCVLESLDLYNGVNGWLFKTFLGEGGLCGSIQQYNKSYLNLITCKEGLRLDID